MAKKNSNRNNSNKTNKTFIPVYAGPQWVPTLTTSLGEKLGDLLTKEVRSGLLAPTPTRPRTKEFVHGRLRGKERSDIISDPQWGKAGAA